LPPIISTVQNINKEIIPNSLPQSNIVEKRLPQSVVETSITETPSFVEEPKYENIVKSDEIMEQKENLHDPSKHPSISQKNENHTYEDLNEIQDDKFDLEQEQKNLEIKTFQNDQDVKIESNNEATNIKESKKEKRKKKKKKTEIESISPTLFT
jgi:hypothetical protein